jgi:DinB family protein
MIDTRYPLGQFRPKHELTPTERAAAIEQIAETPDRLRAAVYGLKPEQLDTPYREGGWTVRQVVHHLPDSHMNSYVRFKLALTEREPIVNTYDEALWAQLADARLTGVEVSLALLDALHQRWVILLKAMRPDDFARRINHPELGVISLDWLLGEMAWHGAHHVAHITSLREGMGWR